MFTPVFTSQFKRDFKRVEKRNKDMAKLQAIVLALASGESLAKKHYDHLLTGNYVNRRECHIEPD
jgi:mRNA interferase YafQ